MFTSHGFHIHDTQSPLSDPAGIRLTVISCFNPCSGGTVLSTPAFEFMIYPNISKRNASTLGLWNRQVDSDLHRAPPVIK